uniref:Uncharacterized protein n=1 Tax=Magallana gigas TaxID=29159 RepID=K1R0C4_MAGGI
MYLAQCGQHPRQVDIPDKRDLKMVSGYDLLDKLSRRRMYARSNVREKSSLSDHCDQQDIIISLDGVGIEVEGLGSVSEAADPRSALAGTLGAACVFPD